MIPTINTVPWYLSAAIHAGKGTLLACLFLAAFSIPALAAGVPLPDAALAAGFGGCIALVGGAVASWLGVL